MKLIVGLGNPGRSYANHRHNIGFMVADELAGRHGIEMSRRSFGAFIGSGAMKGEAVIIAKPQTFMNVSGESAAPLLRYYKLDANELIAVHDDLDIELGRMKIARGSGHGGHNGIRSLIDELGSNDFLRVRVGIGRPPAGFDAANYVLTPFDKGEEELLKREIGLAADAVEMLISEGLAAAQQKYH